jgi:hypothetical protein
MKKMACNLNEKGGLFSRPQLRGKDLNLRPLGYEGNLTFARVAFSIVYVDRNGWFCPFSGSSWTPNQTPTGHQLDTKIHFREAVADCVGIPDAEASLIYWRT